MQVAIVIEGRLLKFQPFHFYPEVAGGSFQHGIESIINQLHMRIRYPCG